MKQKSVFFESQKIENAITNASKFEWAGGMRDCAIEAAKPWLEMSDDYLFELIFGNTIKRSWMVLSNGDCPTCGKSVPMYSWIFKPMEHPYKAICPHCGDMYPKNDFGKYYTSGLGVDGIFKYELADKSLLFNTEHPDSTDPLHLFGVDDGNGLVIEGTTWWFIATYLVYGQWHKVILAGIENLARAYVLTGNKIYAHKTGILIDRLADVFPDFDFATQGIVYEFAHPSHGYISYWANSCVETRSIALAYDQVYSVIKEDKELVAFLNKKAKKHMLSNKKESFEDIHRNISERIFEDAILNAHTKNRSNYPQSHITEIVLRAVCDYDKYYDKIMELLDGVITKTTAVDGVTGEKGLSSYGAHGIRSLGAFLGMLINIDDSFITKLLEKYPRIIEGFRFHIDTWCLQSYYPPLGDDNFFAGPQKISVNMYSDKYSYFDSVRGFDFNFSKNFMWRLYKHTNDVAFIQTMYSNVNEPESNFCPASIFAPDINEETNEFLAKIKEFGTEIKQKSIVKNEWHVGVLHSGEACNRRAAWVSFDDMCGGAYHGHCNGMAIGLYAKDSDFMVDFGYPPVHYGDGWGSPHVQWYRSAMSHNTAVVDLEEHASAKTMGHTTADILKDILKIGKCALFFAGNNSRAIRVSGPEIAEVKQFDRLVWMIDIDEVDSYLVDVFRIVGGKDHIKLMNASLGKLEINGLDLHQDDGFALYSRFMRNSMVDKAPDKGFEATWEVMHVNGDHTFEDQNLFLKYTDLTEGLSSAYTQEVWISFGDFNTKNEKWIPRIAMRKTVQEGEAVTAFAGIIEPFEKESKISKITRLIPSINNVPFSSSDNIVQSSDIAIEIILKDGSKDILISADVEDAAKLKCSVNSNIISIDSYKLITDAEVCIVRYSPEGNLKYLSFANGSFVEIDGKCFSAKDKSELEMKF